MQSPLNHPAAVRPSRSPGARRFHDAPTLRRRVSTWDGDPPRVLIVEESAAQRAVCEESLGSLGYEVVCASSGEEALRVAPAARPAVVVMEVSLDDTAGTEAMRLFKAGGVPGGSAVTVIATSQGADAFDVARGAGCDAFLCKPVSPFTLDEVIRALVKEEDARAAQLAAVSGFDCARALTLVGFELLSAEALCATLERGDVVLYVPLVPRLAADVLDAILRAVGLPPARFAELLERFSDGS